MATWWVYLKEVRDRLVLVSVAGGVLVLLCLIAGVLWEPLQVQFAAVRDLMPPGILAMIPGGDMSNSAGWINAQVLSLSAPGGLTLVAIISALRGSVHEEDRGTLALLLGSGIGRMSFATAKTLAMMTHVALAALLLWLGLAASNAIWSLGLTPAHLIASSIHAMVLAWFFGMATLTLGLSTGRSRLSALSSVALAAAAFLVATFFPLSSTLSGWERISPWFYFSDADPLNTGLTWSYLGLLVLAALPLYAVSLRAFSERDLRT